jgi:NAD(P)H-dependent flavin oxidoreductase YrpB (nitropropane dioxygenase family)
MLQNTTEPAGLGGKLIRTKLCGRMGIDLPIVQAPIGGISTPQLAAAVSNAGGLGMLSLTWRTEDETQRLLRETFALTKKPFGVNLVLEWDPASNLEICFAEGVKTFSFFWGDSARFVRQMHDAGGIVMHTVGSAAEAKRCVDAGVDVIVAQGWEAGGHVWGEVTTMALVPRVVDAVAPVPVIAAGGIADGRGLVAALALGAQAAMLGTRFVAADEADSHAVYRQSLVSANETSTVRTELFDGGWERAAHRVIKNSTYASWEESGKPAAGKRPGEGEIVSRTRAGKEIPRYHSNAPIIALDGNPEQQALYAGQGVGLIRDCKPAAQIVSDIVSEAEAAVRSLQTLID